MAKTRIKHFREKLGCSEEWLAEELGVSTSTISRIESDSGSITLDRLEKIAELLNLTPVDLMDEKYLRLGNNYNSKVYGPIESSYIRFLIYENERLNQKLKFYQEQHKTANDNLNTISLQLSRIVEYISQNNIKLNNSSKE